MIPDPEQPETPDAAHETVRDWQTWSVGTRVMVRRRIADPVHKFTDVLGTILTTDSRGLLIDSRSGEVFVPGDVIVTGKPIPPPPPRRRPRN